MQIIRQVICKVTNLLCEGDDKTEQKSGIEDAIKDIFSSIILREDNETKVNYGKIIEKLTLSGYDIENAEIFNIMIKWQIEKILDVVICNLNAGVQDTKNMNKIKFLYNNYTYMKWNIEKLIVQREGSSCCADKSRHILKAYKNYLANSSIPEISNERQYWEFNFGTYDKWFNLCNGLYKLYYGNPADYLAAYKELLDSELRNQE